jgi:hypothetical protein
MTEDHAHRARKPPELGTPMTLAFGAQEEYGAAAGEMTVAVQGDISMAYGAEWHSEVLAPLVALGVNFIDTIAAGGGDLSNATEIGKGVNFKSFRDKGDDDLLPGIDTFQRDFIIKSFNRDAAVADDLGAVLQVSTLFAPMMEQHEQPATGASAVEVIAPDLIVCLAISTRQTASSRVVRAADGKVAGLIRPLISTRRPFYPPAGECVAPARSSGARTGAVRRPIPTVLLTGARTRPRRPPDP